MPGNQTAELRRLISDGGFHNFREITMNWNQIEGHWHQRAGQVKVHWAKLSDDDLKSVAGKKEQLVGKIQEHYGILRDEAERQIDEWIARFKPNHREKA